MKALVVGGGSIGRRHLRNLRAAGVRQLAVVEPDTQRGREAASPVEAAHFPALEQGLAWGGDLVCIASPTHLHLEQALAAARAGRALFIEKPLSHSRAGVAELADEVESRGLVSLVGCNMRFHPGPARIRALLDQGAIGRILFARVHAGSYLPAWRPAQDYRTGYSASAAMGGGCILDLIHEIDLARWFLGEVSEVFCMAEHLSSLEIDAEDVVSIVARHASGARSEIHLDYVQRTYERGCQLVGEQGTIQWDFTGGNVRWFDAGTGAWTEYADPEGWEVNAMYEAELAHLLASCEAGTDTVLPVREAARVLAVALAAKESARTGRLVGVAPVA
jgi:predicted dehydrogenase